MNTIRRFGFTLLLAFLFSTATQAGDFAQPRPGLHTGGQPTPEQLDALAAQGVRTVIDLRPDSEDHGYDEARAAGQRKLRYVQLPIAGPQDLTPAKRAEMEKTYAEARALWRQWCASPMRASAFQAELALTVRRLAWLRHLPQGDRWGRDVGRLRAAHDLLC